MKNRTLIRYITKLLVPVLLAGSMHTPAMAAVIGSGTEEDPVEGTVREGDELPPEAYVRNLSRIDGTRIILSGQYVPNTYSVSFSAEGGSFPDGSGGVVLPETYGEQITFPEVPEKQDKWFAGWFLKGNGLPQDAPENARELLMEDSIYYLAPDDPEDRSLMEPDEDGRPVTKALWRNNAPLPSDGFEADDPAVDEIKDFWDETHSNSRVIEQIPELITKEEYRKKHGRTAFQYGRVRLDAETDGAASYRWYLKRPGEQEYTLLDETSPVLTLSGLTRADHQTGCRCEALIGEQEGVISYETELTVYWLPKPVGIAVKEIGKDKG